MKPRTICCFIFLVFVISLSTSAFAYEREIEILASDMSEKIANSGKAKIAVVDFTDLRGDVTELGRFISEELSVSLAGAGKGFKIVDRTHLKSILQEHKLSSTGLIDPATARKLGEIAGVEALITGSLTPFGDTVRITVKVLDTETAEIIDAKKENIAKTEIIEELLAVTFEPRPTSLQNNSNRSNPGSSKQSEIKYKKNSGDSIISNFNGKELEGWKIENGDLVNPGSGGSGGSTGNGCLVFKDKQGSVGYFVAPSKFLGEWRPFSKLEFDIWCTGGRFFNKSNGVEYYDIILKSGFATALYRFPEKPSSTWSKVSIPLNSNDGWIFQEGATTLNDVLVNVTEFKIRSEYGDGEDKTGLDNVSLIR